MTTSATPRPDGPAPVRSWPLLLLAAPAFVAVWSGWVGLGRLTGFGDVEPLPGIVDGFTIDTAITLPVGVETYAAYALKVWLTPGVAPRARTFARWSALTALLLGAAGQVAYHLMTAPSTGAPWVITAVVSCLPVAVLGMGAGLAHLVHTPNTGQADDQEQGDEQGGSGDVAGPVVPTVLPGRPALPVRPVVDVDDEWFRAADTSPARHPAGPARSVPAPRRTRRTGGAAGAGGSGSTAARVARLRARHPDLTAGEIARRLGVTDRTVRRYLRDTGTGQATAGPTAVPDDTTDDTTTSTPDSSTTSGPAGGRTSGEPSEQTERTEGEAA